ncbi:MAG: helix-hairpin-helix domain-containing protein [Victivallaceae bacterium]|nr:helix-hairpin-helix domain-containing protein [Victivallaceae bacterium]
MIDFIDFDLATCTIPELEALVLHHNQCYWDDNTPQISDDRYDQLIRRLSELAPASPLLEQVNAPAVAGTGKVHHLAPMLSLDKAYSLEEVLDWATKVARGKEEPLLVQPKYDGISAHWDGRILATRGDGQWGENITDKLPLIELESPGYTGPVKGEVLGEIVIRSDDFASLYSKIVKKGGGHYKNSRNAVAGIMGLKDPADMIRQHAKLTLVDYELISRTLALRDLENEWSVIIEFMEKLPYPLDGIVLKLADKEYRESLGSTAHHPRGAIAFKFSGIRQTSRLADILWSFGKNCLTPVAVIDPPVEIGSTTIRRASLHNVQNLIEMDLQIGDEITVERAGDVIPHIVDSTPGEHRKSPMIHNCPGCGALLVRRGPELTCPNPDCRETRIMNLLAAVRSIGIERLGEPNIRKMYDNLEVRTLGDILRLSRERILTLDNFKDKSADNLLAELENAKTVPEYRLLAALNIPHVGLNMARQILETKTFAQLRGMTQDSLAELRGVGPERAGAIVETLSENRDFIDELLRDVTLTRDDTENSAVARPKICFTGKMPEKRNFYAKLAEKRGYLFTDDVTSDLKILVAADPEATGGKLAKARKMGIEIASLAQWLADDKAPEEKSAEPSAPQPSEKTEPEQLSLFQ